MNISKLFDIAIVAAGLSISACSAPAPAAVIVTGETPFVSPTQGQGGGAASTGTTGSQGTAAGSATDVPCDVATYLATKCTSCHGDPPLPSALAGLVTLADLKATSKEDPTKNEAELSVARMKDAAKPMPPGALPSAADVAILENWISAGYPTGSCGDAGVPMARPVVSVFKNAPAFVAGTGKNAHNAGQDCVGCHNGPPQPGEDTPPHLSFGGTVYDKSGAPVAGAEVRLVDAKGQVISVYSGSRGTFSSGKAFTAPAQVGVRDANNVSDMITPLQANGGGCSASTCHCTGAMCTVPPIHLP